MLQVVQVLEEEHPGGLLGVVQLGGAAGLFPEDIVDVLEGLLEHKALILLVLPSPLAGYPGLSANCYHDLWASVVI